MHLTYGFAFLFCLALNSMPCLGSFDRFGGLKFPPGVSGSGPDNVQVPGGSSVNGAPDGPDGIQIPSLGGGFVIPDGFKVPNVGKPKFPFPGSIKPHHLFPHPDPHKITYCGREYHC